MKKMCAAEETTSDSKKILCEFVLQVSLDLQLHKTTRLTQFSNRLNIQNGNLVGFIQEMYCHQL